MNEFRTRWFHEWLTKYTLQELQAIVEVLDYLTDDMAHMSEDMKMPLAFTYYGAARTLEKSLVDQQAQQAPELTVTVTRRKPIKVNPSSMYGTMSEDPADPPAEPDMFGWVGDALDDLCAAGEVHGSND